MILYKIGCWHHASHPTSLNGKCRLEASSYLLVKRTSTMSSHRRLLAICAMLVLSLSFSFKPFQVPASRSQQQQREARPLEGPACVLDQATIEVTSHPMVQFRQSFLWAIPFLSSLFAFVSFKGMTRGFHAIVEALSNHEWLPSTEAEVDLQTQVITQVVNGPVITSISVLFATLVSTTVSFLHDRQITMKSLFVKQIDELRMLQVLLKQMPESLRQQAKHLTHEYTEHLAQDECGEQSPTDTLDASLRELLVLLQSHMATRNASPLAGMAYESVTRIQQAQSNRWTALQTKFPAMHYTTLSLLALAICLSFLVATDQSIFIFESLQVRILWTILIGAFTSLAVVCYDLSSPFMGAYQVRSQSVCVRVCVFVLTPRISYLDCFQCRK